MSEQTPRDFDTSIPTVEDAALYWQWGGHIWQAPERFDRMIAKVKADALREAAYALVARAGLLKPMHGEHPAVKELLERADRSEEKANG